MKKFFVIIGGMAFVATVAFTIISINKRYKSSQYEGTAVPYIKMVVPEISTWNPAIIKKYMPPESLETTSEEKMTKIIAYLSRLGELKQMEEPNFSSLNSVETLSNGQKPVVTYTVDAEYENGAAVFTISLFDNGESFNVYNFNIHSEALTQ